MPSGSVHPVTDGILIDLDDTAGTPQRITFCQGPHRNGVIRLRRAYTEVRRTLAHRKRALTHGAQQSRNVAIGSTTDQMRAKAALAVMCALWVRTVACGELHSSLLMRTVCRASGVYSERPHFFRLFMFIHAIEGHHQISRPTAILPGKLLDEHFPAYGPVLEVAHGA